MKQNWIAFVLLLLPGPHSLLADDRRNVLFIAIDDLNDWVGCLGGHPQAITPHIDHLARRGTLFSNAHCQGPICGPSRASLLSGKYPHSTGLYQQPAGKPMEDDTEHFRGHLLPEYFAQHGYKTLGCGKITHGYSPKLAFQEFGGTFGGSGPKPKQRFHYHLPDVPWTGTQTDWGAFPESDAQMPDSQVVDWAIEQLGKKHEAPIFLAVGIVRPHVPFYVPPAWFEEFPVESLHLPAVRKDDLEDVPPIGRRIHEMPKYPTLEFLQADDDRQFRLAVQAYLACIRFVDAQVGRLLKALEQSEYAEDTLIVLFSDHGYHLGEKNRVSKHSLWEESTRVPLIVVDGQASGQECQAPVGLIDLYPTLLELCHLPQRLENEGCSLVPLLRDPQAPWREAILTTYARLNHSLRGRQFRYTRYEDGSEELYDHAQDPQEWVNLAGRSQHAEVVAKLKSLLPRHDADYHPATRPGAVNAWFAEHFKEHGVE